MAEERVKCAGRTSSGRACRRWALDGEEVCEAHQRRRRESLPQPPEGSSETAVAQWWAVVEEFDLDDHETAILREVCRTITMLDELDEVVRTQGPMIRDGQGTPKVHPAVVESRQLRITLARLFAALRMPEGEQEGEGDGRRSTATKSGRPQRRGGARGLYSVPGRAS